MLLHSDEIKFLSNSNSYGNIKTTKKRKEAKFKFTTELIKYNNPVNILLNNNIKEKLIKIIKRDSFFS